MSYKLEFPQHSQEQVGWMAIRTRFNSEKTEKKDTPDKVAEETIAPMIDDKLIAHAAKKALRRNIDICMNDIKIKVKEGWVTLYGEQNWNYQRESARNCLHLKGIKGIINNITVKSDKNMLMAFMWENLAIQ